MDEKIKGVMPTYGRQPVCFVKGKGMWLIDDLGDCYMDMVSGVAVNALGHCSEVMINALQEQAKELIHVSNLYWNKPQVELADKLLSLSGGDFKDVFFCNSGTEALEGAIKLCKKFGNQKNKSKLLFMSNSFHGRSTGALAITGQPKYQLPFGALLQGCISVPLNDGDELKKALDEHGDEIASVFIEPIQGEGGVIQVEDSFLKEIEAFCKEKEAILVFDEVQCGAGRLGTYYAYQSFSVKPDVVCMAKGLGGGVPIGAIIANQKASVFEKSDHGSTFGGNPLMCAVSLAVTDKIAESAFLEQVKETSKYIVEQLGLMKAEALIKDYRGKGLLLGIVVDSPNQFVQKAHDNKLLLVAAGSDAVRILPPLNTTLEDAKQFMELLRVVAHSFVLE
ncbi:MAG TPA: aspartate aminotransferase family protein [Clostridiales bacterium UBA8960]|jgi:acetylornithine/N-succinyldiaminopimelate aminotransferase|nr:aspartate aminotransferase family protein [Clostridiales bacterium UBA8960]